MAISKQRPKSKTVKKTQTNLSIQNKVSQTIQKSLKLNNIIPDDLAMQYTDNTLIQSREGMFYIFYMQNQHPILMTVDDIRKLTGIDSKCVAWLVLTPLQLAKSINVMEQNFRAFLQTIGSELKDYKEFLEEIEKTGDEVTENG